MFILYYIVMKFYSDDEVHSYSKKKFLIETQFDFKMLNNKELRYYKQIYS